MKNIINWRNSRTRMFMLFIVDVLTIVVNAYLSLIIRHELHYSWIPQEYINSIKSYMLINIITTIVIFILMKLYKMCMVICRVCMNLRLFLEPVFCRPHFRHWECSS